GAVDGESRPVSPTIPLCPAVGFDRDENHGTMLAAIMVGQDDGKAQFVGLAPRARLKALVPGNVDDETWAKEIRDAANHVDKTPQVFVFAGEFDYVRDPSWLDASS